MNKLDVLREETNQKLAKIYEDRKTAHDNYFNDKLTNKEYSEKVHEQEQKEAFLLIKQGLIYNNYYNEILKIYNETIKPYILKKYANKNIGDKRKEEINKFFEQELEKNNIFAYVHFGFSSLSYEFGEFYISLYGTKENKGKYLDFYHFEFSVETWENGLNISHQQEHNNTPLEQLDNTAKILFNKKVETVKKIEELIKQLKEIKEQYNNETAPNDYNATINILDINLNTYDILRNGADFGKFDKIED